MTPTETKTAPNWLDSRIHPTVRKLQPYHPGKPVEELRRELGLERIVKLASNENPLGPSPKAIEAARRAMSEVHVYPDGSAYLLKQAAARHLDEFGISTDRIVVGCGSDEVIGMLGALLLKPGDNAVFGAPAFAMYRLGTLARGAEPVEIANKEYRLNLERIAEAASDTTRIVFLDNPNNPCGTAFGNDALLKLLDRLGEETLVVVDEAYAEYAGPEFETAMGLLDRRPNLIVTRTFSKAYGLAGLRVGYGVGHPMLIDYLERIRQPFNLNSPAQAAAVACLDDEAWLGKAIETNRSGKERIYAGLEALGLPYVPTEANFVLVETGDGEGHFKSLLNHGCIVRSMKGLGLPRHIRVTIGLADEIDFFLDAMKMTLNG